jgi:hypothetical protein
VYSIAGPGTQANMNVAIRKATNSSWDGIGDIFAENGRSLHKLIRFSTLEFQQPLLA